MKIERTNSASLSEARSATRREPAHEADPHDYLDLAASAPAIRSARARIPEHGGRTFFAAQHVEMLPSEVAERIALTARASRRNRYLALINGDVSRKPLIYTIVFSHVRHNKPFGAKWSDEKTPLPRAIIEQAIARRLPAHITAIGNERSYIMPLRSVDGASVPASSLLAGDPARSGIVTLAETERRLPARRHLANATGFLSDRDGLMHQFLEVKEIPNEHADDRTSAAYWSLRHVYHGGEGLPAVQFNLPAAASDELPKRFMSEVLAAARESLPPEPNAVDDYIFAEMQRIDGDDRERDFTPTARSVVSDKVRPNGDAGPRRIGAMEATGIEKVFTGDEPLHTQTFIDKQKKFMWVASERRENAAG